MEKCQSGSIPSVYLEDKAGHVAVVLDGERWHRIDSCFTWMKRLGTLPQRALFLWRKVDQVRFLLLYPGDKIGHIGER
jgi:hypothetical protein